MRVNEVKRERTIEEVVRIEYVAEDGQVFYNEEECRKYEESALFAVSKQLKRLHTNYLSVYDLLDEGSEDSEVEIFDIKSDKDLENLQRYLYLRMTKNSSNDKWAKESIERTFNHVTSGHEVIIWWSYEHDNIWAYGDGSIEGYLKHLRNVITRFITPEVKEENNEKTNN